jgi:predicted kinase
MKKLILMRGVPGSGKSHMAQSLADRATNAGLKVTLLSTDNYFLRQEKQSGATQYVFDGSKLAAYHALTQQEARTAMRARVDIVIVDNTNIALWQMRPYLSAANSFGYAVTLQEPESPWWLQSRQSLRSKDAFALAGLADELAKRNQHGVNSQIIFQMLRQWEEVTLQDQSSRAANQISTNGWSR